jgi:hypothetical protein
LEVYDIFYSPEKHTWQDVDAWYRNALPNHADEDYYRNLKQILFYYLIDVFQMDTEADWKTISYYVQEQIDHGILANPSLFVRCLDQLDERFMMYRWIFLRANEKYSKDMQLLNGQPVLKEAFGPRYQE